MLLLLLSRSKSGDDDKEGGGAAEETTLDRFALLGDQPALLEDVAFEDDDGLRLIGLLPVPVAKDEVERRLPGLPPPVPGVDISGGLT